MKYFFRSILTGLFLIFALNNYANAGRILLIASYHAENEWSSSCIDGIKDVIGSKHKIDIIYMDTKRKPKSEYQKIAEHTMKQLSEKKPDLIMTGDDNALKYLAPAFEKMNTPVVFYGINANPREYFSGKALPKNITGVLERRMLMALGRMILKIVPVNKKRFLILFDDSRSTKALIKTALHGEKTLLFKEITMEWQSLSYYDDWQKTVKNANKKYDALIVETWYTIKDSDTGKVVPESEVMEWTGQNSPIPVFGSKPQSVGPGKFVGAKALTGLEHGGDAAKMALEILDKNKKASSLKVLTTMPTKYYFNKDNLRKYNLKLPSEIEKKAVFH